MVDDRELLGYPERVGDREDDGHRPEADPLGLLSHDRAGDRLRRRQAEVSTEVVLCGEVVVEAQRVRELQLGDELLEAVLDRHRPLVGDVVEVGEVHVARGAAVCWPSPVRRSPAPHWPCRPCPCRGIPRGGRRRRSFLLRFRSWVVRLSIGGVRAFFSPNGHRGAVEAAPGLEGTHRREPAAPPRRACGPPRWPWWPRRS